VRKRPTIAEIAQRAGVSTGAVSYALNGQRGVSEVTRDRILAIADELGWRPSLAARSLSGSRVHAVGLILARPASTLGMEPFFMRFISGVEAALSASNTALLLQVAPDHDAANATMRQWWAERRIDGVLVTDVFTEDSRLPVITELGLPAVLVGRPREAVDLPAVWSDDHSAVSSVVDYLVALGHHRIARVAGLDGLEHTRTRTEAFRAACRRHRLGTAPVVGTDYSPEEAASATRQLLIGSRPPTAITYDSDVMAVAGLKVAREMGLSVPDDLSLVAGDDSQLCTLVHPAISALSRDVAAYGEEATNVLLALLDGEPAPSRPVETAKLIPRGSTAPPRRS
jgi:DNA-binding LacI/PurR family transcriptional regulator